jgi:hypothetical protein
MDLQRGLFVITLVGPYNNRDTADGLTEIWFYSHSAKQWHKKIPARAPGFTQGELTFDAVKGKYVYFGQADACNSALWIYDYDANTWTEVQRNGRAYNDNDQAASTWAPVKHKNAFEYCARYNVHVAFGGGQWVSDMNCSDWDEHRQGFYLYRVAEGTTAVSVNPAARPARNVLISRPNPFSAFTVISGNVAGPEPLELGIYDIQGRLISALGVFRVLDGIRWDGTVNGRPLKSGIYFLRAEAGKANISRKMIISR